MHRALPVALALVVLAGCVQSGARVETATSAAGEVLIDEDRPDTTLEQVATGPAAAPDEEATLDAPPRLVPGEWWRIRYESAFLEADMPDLVRVVAEATPEGYVVGMPHEGWFKEAIAYHAPAFGDIGPDLSYHVHNVRFEPLRFPLTAGATWDTDFVFTPMRATVESVDGAVATIVLTPTAEPGPEAKLFELGGFSSDARIRLTYDAQQHEVVRFESAIGSWEVVEHGYGFEGWVTIPRGEHTAIDYGRVGPVTPGEHPTTRTVEVAGGFNRLTLMHAVFAVAPGAYRMRTVAPDGTEFATDAVGRSGLTLRFYEAVDPDGTWTSEEIVGGVAGTYTMGIAYHQYDIRLPDGLKRSDHSHEVIR